MDWTIDALAETDPLEFERIVCDLFKRMGYTTTLTALTGDHGIDIFLERGSARGVVQCKRYSSTVGEKELRDFYGAMQHEAANIGFFVTTGSISRPARAWLVEKNIHILDGPTLVESLTAHGVSVPGAPVEEPTLGWDSTGALLTSWCDAGGDGRAVLFTGAPPQGWNPRRFVRALAAQAAINETFIEVQAGRNYSPPASDLHYLLARELPILLIDELESMSETDLELLYQRIHERTLLGLLTIGWTWNRSLVGTRTLRAFDFVSSAHTVDWDVLQEWSSRAADAQGQASLALERIRIFGDLPFKPATSDEVLESLGLIGAVAETRSAALRAHDYLRQCNEWMYNYTKTQRRWSAEPPALTRWAYRMTSDAYQNAGEWFQLFLICREKLEEFYQAQRRNAPTLPAPAPRFELALEAETRSLSRIEAGETRRRQALEQRAATRERLIHDWLRLDALEGLTLGDRVRKWWIRFRLTNLGVTAKELESRRPD